MLREVSKACGPRIAVSSFCDCAQHARHTTSFEWALWPPHTTHGAIHSHFAHTLNPGRVGYMPSHLVQQDIWSLRTPG